MKVVIMTNYYPPEIGSAAHLMYDLATKLSLRGHDVMVATGMPQYNMKEVPPRYRRKLFMNEEIEGVKVARMVGLPFYGKTKVTRGINHLIAPFKLFASALASSRADVVFVHSPPLPPALAAAMLAKLFRARMVMNVQDIFPQEAIDLGMMKNRLIISFFEAIEARAYKYADAIIVHSAGNRRFLLSKKALAPEKVFAIPNWVDVAHLSPGKRDNWFRAKLGIGDVFLATFAGVLGWIQDLGTIVKIAQLVAKHDIHIAIVGDGVAKEHLMEMSQKEKVRNLHFHNMVSFQKYPDVLRASDVGLVTLIKDIKTPVVPSKIISIMAVGKPVVATMPLGGDAPKLIQAAKCGYCFAAGDYQGVATALVELKNHPDLVSSMGRNGRAAVLAKYSADVCVAEYERVLSGHC